MPSAVIAAVIGGLSWAFVEGMGRFYPARATWMRWRRVRGRRTTRRIRDRFAAAAERGTPRWLVIALAVLVVGWVASASLLDKRWWEVVLDVLPYAFVGVAFLRMPATLRKVVERMRTYERDAGNDPDRDIDDDEDGGRAAEIAL